MLEVARFETSRRVRGTIYLTLGLLAYIALSVALFPTFERAGIDFDVYLQSLPPEVQRGFIGNVETLSTIEGYLVAQVYQQLWVLLLGVYFAYAGARSISTEVENASIDLLLANPISRTRVVVGKFLSLAVVVVVVNVVSLLAIYEGVLFISEEVDPVNLALVHGLSVVYLLAASAVGLVLSVVFDSTRRAQAAAIGAIFGTFLVDSLTYDTDYEWLGAFSLSRYFDAGTLLTEGEVAWNDVAVLVVVTVGLVILAAELFERKDVSG